MRKRASDSSRARTATTSSCISPRSRETGTRRSTRVSAWSSTSAPVARAKKRRTFGRSEPSHRSTRRRRRADVTHFPVGAAPEGSELCLQCGLCCDGTMFSEVGVRPYEREYVVSLGLPVEPGLDGSGITVFQPCPAFVGGCCSLYEVGRP